MHKTIFFDNNATTPLLPAAKKVMFDVIDLPLNPSSMHAFGRSAKHILEDSRERVKQAVGADDEYQVIFTSSGTESNNLAIKGLRDFKVLTSEIEHASVISAVGQAIIPVNKDGVVNLAVLEEICARESGKQKFLVSIMSANNETGVIQPIRQAAEIVHRYGGLIHSDASQSFGKVDFNISELNLDMTTISSHKCGGPMGVAALVFRKNIPLAAMMFGGGQELRYRPGTQNLPAIRGFAIASEVAVNNLNNYAKLAEIRDYIQREIKSISPDPIVFGENADRLPNTLSIAMPNVSSETQVIHFDTNGFAISAGSACSSGRVDLPHVQIAMGYNESVARSSIRVSLGIDNNMEEAKLFVKVWGNLFTNSNNSKAYKE
ncbi:MAG: cysteine desulfurase 2 [Candidatus Midichloriaceae bacterium]|jgi:cysteine desulfurase|nr:cysteine desulfurase 2 [Candidatus Midichloriaceae bacterium]